MKLEDLNHIRSRIKIKKKPKRCSIRELYIYINFQSICPYEKSTTIEESLQEKARGIR